MEPTRKFEENFILGQANQLEKLQEVVMHLSTKVENGVKERDILSTNFQNEKKECCLLQVKLSKVQIDLITVKRKLNRRIKKLRRRTRFLETYIREF